MPVLRSADVLSTLYFIEFGLVLFAVVLFFGVFLGVKYGIRHSGLVDRRKLQHYEVSSLGFPEHAGNYWVWRWDGLGGGDWVIATWDGEDWNVEGTTHSQRLPFKQI